MIVVSRLRRLPRLVVTPMEMLQKKQFKFPGRIQVISKDQPVDPTFWQMFTQEKLVGFDTEAKPPTLMSTRRNKTSLFQLSTADVCLLWRVGHTLPKELVEFLGNPEIVKVAQGAKHELSQLYQDFGVECSGFIDLYHIATEMRLQPKSLEGAVAIFLERRLNKGQRLSNWENESLTPAQIEYAACDAYASREVLRVMREKFGNTLAGDHLIHTDVSLASASQGESTTPSLGDKPKSILSPTRSAERLESLDTGPAHSETPQAWEVDDLDLEDIPFDQALETLTKFCQDRLYFLSFHGYETACCGGFRATYKVDCHQASARAQNQVKDFPASTLGSRSAQTRGNNSIPKYREKEVFYYTSNKPHRTYREAQNDCALVALAGLAQK